MHESACCSQGDLSQENLSLRSRSPEMLVFLVLVGLCLGLLKSYRNVLYLQISITLLTSISVCVTILKTRIKNV